MAILGSILGMPEQGDKTEQTQTETIFLLREEIKRLREELASLQNWPDESPEEPGCYGKVSAWRNRALVAERNLDEAYSRLRLLGAELVEKEAACSSAS